MEGCHTRLYESAALQHLDDALYQSKQVVLNFLLGNSCGESPVTKRMDSQFADSSLGTPYRRQRPLMKYGYSPYVLFEIQPISYLK